MKTDWKILIAGFCLGFTAYLLLMKTQPPVERENERSLVKYWQNVGKYWTKAMDDERKKQS